MTVSPDTNVLLRSVVRDDLTQAILADRVLAQAEIVAISLHALCEFVWVLRQGYGFSRKDTVSALDKLLSVDKVSTDWPAVEAGLASLRAGADFADGVIAHQGRLLGGETFVSFDRRPSPPWKSRASPLGSSGNPIPSGNHSAFLPVSASSTHHWHNSGQVSTIR